MNSNSGEMNSHALLSGLSGQHPGFTYVLPDDGRQQFQVGRNLLVGNGTGLYINQGFDSNLISGDGTGYHIGQDFASNLMEGNGTGDHTGQGFASSSALPPPLSEAGSGGGIGNLEQPLGSGLLQYTCKAASNEPGKTRKRKSSAESSKDYRAKKNEEVKVLKEKNERLCKDNEAIRRELDDSKRTSDALDREVQQLKANLAMHKDSSNQQENQFQCLTKLLGNMTHDQKENARLKEENARLKEENAKLKAQNDHLMREPYGDLAGEKKWIRIHLQNRKYKLKNHILKLHRLSRNN